MLHYTVVAKLIELESFMNREKVDWLSVVQSQESIVVEVARDERAMIGVKSAVRLRTVCSTIVAALVETFSQLVQPGSDFRMLTN